MNGSFWMSKTAIGNRNGLRLRIIGDKGSADWIQNNSEELYLSCRNIHNVNLVSVVNFSTYDIVNSDFILFDKESIEVLNKKTW